MSCVAAMHRGHKGDVCCVGLISWRYELRNGDLLALSWASNRLVPLSSSFSCVWMSGVCACRTLLMGVSSIYSCTMLVWFVCSIVLWLSCVI